MISSNKVLYITTNATLSPTSEWWLQSLSTVLIKRKQKTWHMISFPTTIQDTFYYESWWKGTLSSDRSHHCFQSGKKSMFIFVQRCSCCPLAYRPFNSRTGTSSTELNICVIWWQNVSLSNCKLQKLQNSLSSWRCLPAISDPVLCQFKIQMTSNYNHPHVIHPLGII